MTDTTGATVRDRLAAMVHDPDRTVLHRALRVVIVMPALFALGVQVLHDPQFALLAAFGSFSALAMADFTGPRASRLWAFAVLALLGAALIALGTVLSQTLWPAVFAMLVVGVAMQFSGALGGQFALGNNSAILAFVVAVMVPDGPEVIPSRIAGWLTAMACAALATAVLWPRHERRDLYLHTVAACRALADIARAAAGGRPGDAGLAAARAAIDRMHDAQRALGFRPIGPPGHQQALLGLIDAIGQAMRFATAMAASSSMHPDDRRLAGAIASTLDAVAAVLAGCADGRRSDGPDIEALIGARHTQLAAFDAAMKAAVAANAPAVSVIAAINAVFPVRVLSYTALSMAIDAVVLTGRSARVVDEDFGVLEPVAAEGTLRHIASVLAPHLSPSSVWFRNSARAGIALALSVLVARTIDIENAFWVVLATLTVLRSNVVTTGATVVSAVVGTFAGFVVATIVLVAFGPNPTLLWLTLPIAVFLATYAPAAISLGAGQAMFALLVVELFNLIVPTGWETGVVRLEAVVTGALVALAAALIMWPKGAAAALRAEVALHVRAARDLTETVYGALLGTNDGTRVDAAREATIGARRRAEEALAAYMGERGAKRVSLAVWATLVRTPVCMRTGDDALIVMSRAGLGVGGSPIATPLVTETIAAVCASFGEFADRLDDPARVPDRALGALMADLDMVAGAGTRHAAMVAAMAEWIEAHRDEITAVTPMIGVSWAANWLGYLAHLRIVSEHALDEVAGQVDTPWWR